MNRIAFILFVIGIATVTAYHRYHSGCTAENTRTTPNGVKWCVVD